MNKQPKENNVIKALLSHLMHSEAYGWPPLCMGPLYQPQRPVIDKQEAKPDEQ